MLRNTLHTERQIALETYLKIADLKTGRTWSIALKVERLFLEQTEHDSIGGQVANVFDAFDTEFTLRASEFVSVAWAMHEIFDALYAVGVLAWQDFGQFLLVYVVEAFVADHAAHQILIVLLPVFVKLQF